MGFTKGMIVKLPHEKAPDFVKFALSIKIDEFIPFLEENAVDGWVNLQILQNKDKQGYHSEINDWKPSDKAGKPMSANQIPDNYKGQGEKEEEDDGSGLPF